MTWVMVPVLGLSGDSLMFVGPARSAQTRKGLQG
jgi:hypothetical protein